MLRNIIHHINLYLLYFKHRFCWLRIKLSSEKSGCFFLISLAIHFCRHLPETLSDVGYDLLKAELVKVITH